MKPEKLSAQEIEANTELLIQASKNGDLEEVKRLILVSNPKARSSSALILAAHNGHIDIVKLLIPVSDPKSNNSRALEMAANKGHIECIKLLIPVSNCNSVLNTLQYEGNDTTLLQQYIDEHEALQQKERLDNTLVETIDNKHKSAKRKM